MENPNPEQNNQDTSYVQTNESGSKGLTWLIIAVIISAIVIPIYYFLVVEEPKSPEPIVQEIIEPEPVVEPEPIPEPIVEEFVEPEPAPETVVEEVEEPKIQLPMLDESDSWLKQQLTQLTWRKELLRLVIDEDMVRRLVVFTDNFAQGGIAYDYSPLVKPQNKFSAIEAVNEEGQTNTKEQWYWDDSQSRRFSLYVDLMRSFEPERLAQWYVEMKPLIDQAYEELGYPDSDFTDTLQDAIVRVLDMELPKSTVVLERPSVMYRYQDEDLESLPDAEKLLLRIGKENLLVIKSFLLEFSDALSRAEENAQ